jgi:hypothetical protein
MREPGRSRASQLSRPEGCKREALRPGRLYREPGRRSARRDGLWRPIRQTLRSKGWHRNRAAARCRRRRTGRPKRRQILIRARDPEAREASGSSKLQSAMRMSPWHPQRQNEHSGPGRTRISTDVQSTIRAGALPARRAQRCAPGRQAPRRSSVPQDSICDSCPAESVASVAHSFRSSLDAPRPHPWRMKISRLHLSSEASVPGTTPDRSG